MDKIKSHKIPRLYVTTDLSAGAEIPLDQSQSHYLGNVLRQNTGAPVLLFNGRDGEWQADITHLSKKGGSAQCHDQTREQVSCPDIWLVFAPVKKEGTDLIIQKATELGVARFCPVQMRRSVASRIKADRVTSISIEAAEQCERLDLPVQQEMQSLPDVLKNWPQDRLLLVCAETGETNSLKTVLNDWKPDQPAALLIGPEGGFDPQELALLSQQPFVRMVSLGPRVLRAETAALAILACWQAWAGDWDKPRVIK